MNKWSDRKTTSARKTPLKDHALGGMDLPHFVFVKVVVNGDGFRDGGWARVKTGSMLVVGELAEYVCALEMTFKKKPIAPSDVKLYVAASVDRREPTAVAELAAVNPKVRLQVGDDPRTINEGSYLLAVVDSMPPTPGKHKCPRPSTPRCLRRYPQLSAPRFLPLTLPRGLTRPLLGSFKLFGLGLWRSPSLCVLV